MLWFGRMAIKFKYKTKDEVPAEQQGLYVEREGAWVLDVDGAVDKSRVDELRANSVTLSNQLAEHKRRFRLERLAMGTDVARSETHWRSWAHRRRGLSG